MMRRLLSAAAHACAIGWLASALVGVAAMLAPAHAAPLLYAYKGAGCTGRAALPQLENMLGRPVDGVVDFNDYTLTPTLAVQNLNWALGCWQGSGRKLAISIGLAFNGMSTAQIAAGGMDVQFAQMGASLVSHGFGGADIRLGWESNGGWYAWGQKGAIYAAAFDRVTKLLHATPGSSFTVWYNPAAGLEMNNELPTAEDGMAHDWYANSWNSGGATSEPGLWSGDLNGWWGFNGLGVWPSAKLPTAVPEFGVGSRSDGHGACPLTGATDCDDPFFMASALAQATKIGARFVGLWDYDAGDYNAEVSDGSRPGEAIELLKVYGAGNLPALLAGASAYTGSAYKVVPPAGYHVILTQLAGGDVEQLAWGSAAGQTIQATDLTKAAAPTLAASITATPIQPGDSVTVASNADGSATITETMAPTASTVDHRVNLSAARKLAFSNGKGGQAGGYWQGGAEIGFFDWWGQGGVATVYVAPQ